MKIALIAAPTMSAIKPRPIILWQAGVKSVSRSSGKTRIVLHDDSRVPVSRGRSKLLRADGWI